MTKSWRNIPVNEWFFRENVAFGLLKKMINKEFIITVEENNNF